MMKPHPVDRMGIDQLFMAPDIGKYVHHMLQLLSSAVKNFREFRDSLFICEN